jgi:hypothetical protein
VGHEKPVEPFADLHVEHGLVRATLLHDPTVEGLDVALYLDGSGSMSEEYKYKNKGAFLAWLFGKKPEPATNQVEPEARWMLEYLATKDRNGLLRVAYWATGSSGRSLEVVGELKGSEVMRYRFPGPQKMGNGTYLAPAMRDFVGYLKEQVKKGARQGCAVFITDGQLHDAPEVKSFATQVAKDIASGRLPRMNFILVGVGDSIDERQLEEISHEEYPGVGHLWCHRTAKEIGQVAELVAVLVDETMTVAAGGTIYDDMGKVVKLYEGRLPAVLEFELREGAKSFTLEVNGQRYTQPLPEDHDEDHDEDEDEDHH